MIGGNRSRDHPELKCGRKEKRRREGTSRNMIQNVGEEKNVGLYEK